MLAAIEAAARFAARLPKTPPPADIDVAAPLRGLTVIRDECGRQETFSIIEKTNQ